MKPINIKKQKTAASKSSNQVLWDGPDIPCINLCEGDTITDVVYKLATEVCKMMEALDVSNPDNYDLSCMDIAHCDKITFQQLLQALIDQVYCENGNGGGGNSGGNSGDGGNTGTPSENCCDDLHYIPHTVFYKEEHFLPSQEEWFIDLSSTDFQATEDGVYELFFITDVRFTEDFTQNYQLPFRVFKDNVLLPNLTRTLNIAPHDSSIGNYDMAGSIPVTVFGSNIQLILGEVLRVNLGGSPEQGGVPTGLANTIIKITKIG
jgi:hypothetical protein